MVAPVAHDRGTATGTKGHSVHRRRKRWARPDLNRSGRRMGRRRRRGPDWGSRNATPSGLLHTLPWWTPCRRSSRRQYNRSNRQGPSSRCTSRNRCRCRRCLGLLRPSLRLPHRSRAGHPLLPSWLPRSLTRRQGPAFPRRPCEGRCVRMPARRPTWKQPRTGLGDASKAHATRGWRDCQCRPGAAAGHVAGGLLDELVVARQIGAWQGETRGDGHLHWPWRGAGHAGGHFAL